MFDFQIGKTRSWVRLRSRDQLPKRPSQSPLKNSRCGTELSSFESHDVATLTWIQFNWPIAWEIELAYLSAQRRI